MNQLSLFWKEKFTDDEAVLLEAVLMAHRVSAFRDNPSSVTFQIAFDASGSYTQAVIAALSTLGDRHGPLVATHDLLTSDHPSQVASEIISKGRKVPGWGTSFDGDTTWNPIALLLTERFSAMSDKLDSVTQVMHTAGKMIRPNPSAYTAATAILLDLPRELTPWLFVQGRLAAWSVLAMKGKS